MIDLSDGTTDTKRRLPVVGELTVSEPDLESVAIDAVRVTVVLAVCAQPLSTKVATAEPSGCVVAVGVTVALPAGHEEVKFTVTAPAV